MIAAASDVRTYTCTCSMFTKLHDSVHDYMVAVTTFIANKMTTKT